VTALYEISLTGSPGQRLQPRRYSANRDQLETTRPADAGFSQELAHLRIRYKNPGNANSELIETPILDKNIARHGSDSFNFAAAVAAFGQKLRGGVYLEDFSYADIAGLARTSRGTDPHGYRSEFMQLVELAATLDQSAEVALHEGNR
jgi:Ca-activated chloride channel family protein